MADMDGLVHRHLHAGDDLVVLLNVTVGFVQHELDLVGEADLAAGLCGIDGGLNSGQILLQLFNLEMPPFPVSASPEAPQS
jgi:hypothetical protein